MKENHGAARSGKGKGKVRQDAPRGEETRQPIHPAGSGVGPIPKDFSRNEKLKNPRALKRRKLHAQRGNASLRFWCRIGAYFGHLPND
jgi:hypothetical protein